MNIRVAVTVTIPDADTVARTIHAAYPPMSPIPWESLRDGTRDNLLAVAEAVLELVTRQLEGTP